MLPYIFPHIAMSGFCFSCSIPPPPRPPPPAASSPSTTPSTPSTQHHQHNTINTTPSRFAWQVQHLEHLRLVLRGRRSTWTTFIEVRGSPATIDYFGRRLVLHGRRSTWSTSASFFCGSCSTWSSSGSFCVAGAALGAPS